MGCYHARALHRPYETIKMNTEKIQQKLQDPQFYKRHIPNLFFIFSFWKKAHQEYTTADSRKILVNHLLRRSEHEDFFYNTYAFSVTEDLDQAKLEHLTRMANGLALGEIRYMSHGTNGFFPLIDEEGQIVDAPDINLGIPGVYLYTVSDTKPEKIDCPVVVVIQKGKELKKWPLNRKAVEEV